MKMNVFEKLQQMRVDLQNMKLTKSGKNAFAKYNYWELPDFVPQVNKLMQQYNLCSVTSFGDIAVLEIINGEKPDERIMFTSPMASAELKQCSPVQSLGAVHTYLRRYLWVNALELTEHDALDENTGAPEPSKQSKPPTTPPKQESATTEATDSPTVEKKHTSALYANYKSRGLADAVVKSEIKTKFGKDSSTTLTVAEFQLLMKWVDKHPKVEAK